MSELDIEHQESINSSESLAKYEVDHLENNHPIGRIKSLGAGDEFILIGTQKFYKHELMSAFGGTFNPGGAPRPKHRVGNAASFGLFAFSYNTLVQCFFTLHSRDLIIPNFMAGISFFAAGALQFLAGVWEMAEGNTFGACSMCSFGAYWFSFGSIFVPGFGIMAAYADDPEEFSQAIAIYLLAWGIFSFILCLLTVKSTYPIFLLLFAVSMDYFLSAASYFTGNVICGRASAGFGFVVCAGGWWLGLQSIANESNSYIRLPNLEIPTL